MGQCPRRLSGLPPATSSVNSAEQEQEELEVYAEDDAEDSINYIRNNRGRRMPNRGRGVNTRGRTFIDNRGRGRGVGVHGPGWRSRPVFQNQTGKPGYGGANPRVATVYEDEHGVLYMEEDEETKELLQAYQDEEEMEEVVKGVNTLELAEQYEEDFSEADLIPSAFLGL